MSTFTTKNTHNQSFESLGEYVKFLRVEPSIWSEGSQQTKTERSSAWSGGVTFDEALKLTETGWPEGVKKLSKEFTNMKGLTASGRYRDIAHDVSGFLPDVPRAIVGMPDCMFSHGEEITRTKPVVKLVVNITVNSSVSPESMTRRGAAVLSYVDNLEQQGQRVELWLYMRSATCGKDVTANVCVKQAGEVLDLDKMAFCMVHPSFFRKLGFKFIETCPWEDSYRGGYGRVADLEEKQLEAMGATVHIRALSRNYHDSKQANDEVIALITKQLNKEPESEAA